MSDNAVAERPKSDQLPALRGPRLPYHPLIEQRFGVDRASWKALVEAIFPLATTTESVVLALSYCKARKLDPFKRNVHIVPIYNRQLGGMVDTIWPGIGELRTTAFRTGEYAGRGETDCGADITMKVGTVEMTFPEWARVTVYRMVKNQRVEFVGPKVYWLETYATAKRNDDTPNEMWRDRPRGQLEKCAEAAALRGAFPEEIGGDYIPEEVQRTSGAHIIEQQKSLQELSARLEGPVEVAGEVDEEGPAGPPHVTPEAEEAESAESLQPLDPELTACFAGLDNRDEIEQAFQAQMPIVSNLQALVAAKEAALAKLPKETAKEGKRQKTLA